MDPEKIVSPSWEATNRVPPINPATGRPYRDRDDVNAIHSSSPIGPHSPWQRTVTPPIGDGDPVTELEATHHELPSRNINSELINPFIDISPKGMLSLVDKFMEKTQIDTLWREKIEKGAFLAQDPGYAFSRPLPNNLAFTQKENAELVKERDHKWKQPFELYRLVIICSLGAAVQGWDETAVNGAQIWYQWALEIGGKRIGDEGRAGYLGLVNAAPYLCCAILGCWLTEPLNNLFGRRGTIFITCLISSITCLWQGLPGVNTWWHLFIARFFLGLGIGPKSSTIPIYAAECVPANIRGGLVMMWQMWTAFGIALGYISAVIFQPVLSGWNTEEGGYCHQAQSIDRLLSTRCSLTWRLTLASPMLLPLITAMYTYGLPESPRWLLLKARQGRTEYYQKAFDSLIRLRGSYILAARDLFLIHHLLDGEERIKREHKYRILELFRVPRNRRAVTASIIVMFLQQFCGVNAFAYYSTKIFKDADYSDKQALLLSMGFGLINFVFAFPAVFTMDTFGRRNLLLSTFPFMALFQFLTGLAFLFDGTAKVVLVAVGMYLFSVAYSPGEGPVPFVYAAESMPLYLRALGMSLVTAVNWFFNFLLAVTFPKFQEAFHPTGALGWYAAWCVIGWFLILFFVPETKDLTLEQLDETFSIETSEHIRYGLEQCKYFIRRFIFHQRKSRLVKPVLDRSKIQGGWDMNAVEPRGFTQE